MRIRDLPILMAIPALLLAGCASIFTPRRCADILSGANSAEAVVQVLQARGIQSERAKRIADLLLIGRVSVEAVCLASPEQINAAPVSDLSRDAPAPLTPAVGI